MKLVFCILLTLAALLCLSTVLVAILLPEPSGAAQLVEGPVEAAFVGKETPPAPEEPPPPEEESQPSDKEEASSSAEAGAASEEESLSSPAAKEVFVPKVEISDPAEEWWRLRLVNWENPLPVDFEPEYEAVQNRFVMDKRVAPIARQMIADAQSQGVTLVVNSAYRPYSAQQQIYNTWLQRYLAQGRSEQEAQRLTECYVARPGYSEHQLGLALDIVAADDGAEAEGWLAAHAPDYGFILRYPEDKTEFTHTAYESWHYRYVGVPVAREITDQGLCLEEYLAGREKATG